MRKLLPIPFVLLFFVTGLCAGSMVSVSNTSEAFARSGNVEAALASASDRINTAPEITCPGNITVSNDAGSCEAVVDFAATETTGVPASTITYSQSPGTAFPVGTTTVTATATNSEGTDQCTFTITVLDNEAPVANCQDITVQLDNFGALVITAGDVATSLSYNGFTGSGQALGSSASYGVSLGDVDGDGDLDAFVANYNQGNEVWLNDGSGTYSGAGSALGSGASRGVGLGDLDGDGDLDAFVANENQSNEVWLNDGSGAYTGSGQTLGGSASRGIRLGDVDGDGDLDAYVANYNQGNKVWLNNGIGGFMDSGQSLGTNASQGLSLGDVDGDGDLDAFVANFGGPFGEGNKVWLNDGSGTFTGSGQTLSGSASLAVSLGDVDSDGDLDAFFANVGANEVWLNNGNGSFANSGQAIGNSTSYGINLGDVDGDGDLDAFVANAGTGNKVWLNNGNGIFTDSGQSLGSNASRGVSLGDVDGDGDLDAYVANLNQGNQVWLNNTQPDGISDNCAVASASLDINSFDCQNIGDNPVTLTVNDVNGNSNSCTAIVTVADNTAPVAVCQDITVQLDNMGTVSISASDISGTGGSRGLTDRRQATESLSGFVAFLRETKEERFNPSRTASSTDNCGIASASLDINSFGCSDVGDNEVTLTVTDGSGNSNSCTATVTVEDNVAPTVVCYDITVPLDNFGQAVITPEDLITSTSYNGFTGSGQTLGGSVSYGLSLGDLDGDSDLDAFVANSGGNELWSNNGSGAFTSSALPLGSSTSYGISLGDVDGDSDLDAFVANDGANKVWLNNGNGAFADSGQSLGSSASWEINLSDLDGDGDLDAFVANFGEGNKVLFNDGNGTFTDSGQSLGFGFSLGLSLGDVDGDGDLDAFVANYNQGGQVWLNDGSGTFTDSGQVLGSNASLSLSLGDVDGDGDLDAYVANFNQGNKVWLNDGSGIFTDSGQSLGTAPSLNVNFGDVDSDGDLDAFVANNGGNKVWLNDGSGTFTDSGQSLGSSISWGLHLGDLDGDNDLDAFVAAEGGNEVWFNDTQTGSILDNCGIASTSIDINSFGCKDIGTNTVVLTVTDVNGNATTCSATATVEDDTAPIALCKNITVQLGTGGTVTVTPNMVDNGSGDGCGLASLSLNQTNFGCADTGGNSVTLTATDGNGNESSCSAIVTVEDNTPPTVFCKNITVQLSAGGTATVTPNMVVNGSGDACGLASLTLSQTSFGCADVGSNSVTLFATDDNANVSSCTATVFVEDEVAPTAVCRDVTLHLGTSGAGTLIPGIINNGSSDACGIGSLSLSQTSFDCADVGSNTILLTVEDVNGNQSSCTSSVTVADNVAPVALCNDITVELDATGNGFVSEDSVNGGSFDACGQISLSLSQSNFDCEDIGSNSVTLTVTDQNGNEDSCEATVEVEDDTDPIALCQDITVQLGAGGTVTVAATAVDAGSSDACGISELELDKTDFDCGDIGNNEVTLEVTDNHNNDDKCEAVITVEDNLSPVALCQDITVQLDAAGNGGITASAVNNGSSDNCGIGSLVLSQTSFDCDDMGTNTVTLTVTDQSVNSSTCSASVTVEDNIPPIAKCRNTLVELNANGSVTVQGSAVDNGSSDNCGIINYSLSQSTFDCTDIGGNPVTLTVTDANGNVNSCGATVIVADFIAPVALCQDVTLDLNEEGEGTLTVNEVNNGSSDACEIGALELSQTNFDCDDIGTNTVALTVADISGNESTCESTVTVNGSVAPTAVCQNVTVQLDVTGNGELIPEEVDNGSIAGCGLPTLSLSQTSFDCDDIGTNLVTLTVSDLTGNESSCQANVTVEDNAGPTALCEDATVFIRLRGTGTLLAGAVDDGSFDACGEISSLSLSQTTFDCSDVGTHTVTLTVTDQEGNESTCASTVTVVDVIAPVMLCQDVTVQLDDTGNASLNPNTVDNGSSDACGISTLTLSQMDFDCSDVGTNSVILSATDINGNQNSCEAEVTVEGSGACCTADLVLNDDPIPAATYQASNTITSSGSVASGSTVVFKAGQSITLQPGFHAEAGSSFTAQIESCTPVSPLVQSDTPELQTQNAQADLFEHGGTKAVIDMTIAPNPFRLEALIRYTLPDDRPTQLVLIDLLGRVQVLQPSAIRPAGLQEFRLDNSGLSSGLYFVRLRAGDEVITRQVQVIKY